MNPNLKYNFFFLGGGGGGASGGRGALVRGGGGGGGVGGWTDKQAQTKQCINVQVMSLTSSVYDHFII